MYKYYQPNLKDIKDEYGDCVIRALTKAYNKEWLEVFNELLPFAIENQCMPNSRICFENYIEKYGGVWERVKIVNHKRPTVSSFAKKHKVGTYILRVANHIVAVENGVYFDTWDSGNKSVYGYWRIK